MSGFFIRSLLALLIVSASACGKNDSPPAASPAAPGKAAASSTAASAAATETQPVQTDTSAQKPADADTAPTEHVAEVEEGSEAADEPPAKGAAVLKLAQVPPRGGTASKFKEGLNYQRLSPTQSVDVAPDQVQIAEIFWYGCPHCFALDPQIEAWRKSTQPGGKPSYVAFTRIPAAWNDITRFHGRFYFAEESLGKLEELHSLIFQEIHEKGNPLNTIDKAREFFTAHGVDANEFQKNFGALSIERKLDNALLLAQKYRVNGVPTFVVNGKYITDVVMAGGTEQLFQLLNELAVREHAKD